MADEGFLTPGSIDRVMHVVMALAGELYVTRDRLLTLELLLEQSGALDRAQIERFAPSAATAALFATQRDQFIATILDPVIRPKPA